MNDKIPALSRIMRIQARDAIFKRRILLPLLCLSFHLLHQSAGFVHHLPSGLVGSATLKTRKRGRSTCIHSSQSDLTSKKRSDRRTLVQTVSRDAGLGDQLLVENVSLDTSESIKTNGGKLVSPKASITRTPTDDVGEVEVPLAAGLSSPATTKNPSAFVSIADEASSSERDDVDFSTRGNLGDENLASKVIAEEEDEDRHEEDEEDEDDEDEEDDDDDDDDDDEEDEEEDEHEMKNVDEEEQKQDMETETIRRQSLKVGAFGKERLVYHEDYLVHEDWGFCRYLAPADGSGEPEEIELMFADGTMAVPMDDARLLTRYKSESTSVALSSVEEQPDWMKKIRKVEGKVKKQALNIMDLYAQRSRVQRAPCLPDGPDMEEFASKFEFEPTVDQMRCTEEIENDMVWRNVPMDRLLCGDVGFGKTEVAMRAMFRAVRNGRQVALLAPTTILAAQHFRSLTERMPADVQIALLKGGNSRGSREIKKALADGTLDLVVGTHSILSRKVDFGRLGLLVIDEEQKFGVQQKERLKVISTGVDVLTLTATPIPRTLHMSLSGIRDLSTIMSPPAGRQNITTYIMKSTDEIVTRALTRELARGGQVFYVVPKISQIMEACQQIARCVPGTEVVVAHSKVQDLDTVVLQFAMGKGQVLVSTSIIENGIDMPNVNSIIIKDAFMFGLSQLYQMRGRVGRSTMAAYTYLLYPPDYKLSNDAKRRLKSMRELSHLGAGFELANRDLEIRGSGNIFGTDQSGDLQEIGYELYMNRLEQAIMAVRSTSINAVLRCRIDMGFAPVLSGSVPASYMKCDEDERVREIDRLRVCNSFRELVAIAKQWVSEWGPMPQPVQRLFKSTHLNTACRRLGIDRVNLEWLPEKAPEGVGGSDGDSHNDGKHTSEEAKGVSDPNERRGESLLSARRLQTLGNSKDSAVTGNRVAQTKVQVNEDASSFTRGFTEAEMMERRARGEDDVDKNLVPYAMLRGPEVSKELWEVLIRQTSFRRSQLELVNFRDKAGSIVIQAPKGKEDAWLQGNREEWLDHLLSILLPLVEYVETKQSFQYEVPEPVRHVF